MTKQLNQPVLLFVCVFLITIILNSSADGQEPELTAEATSSLPMQSESITEAPPDGTEVTATNWPTDVPSSTATVESAVITESSESTGIDEATSTVVTEANSPIPPPSEETTSLELYWQSDFETALQDSPLMLSNWMLATHNNGNGLQTSNADNSISLANFNHRNSQINLRVHIPEGLLQIDLRSQGEEAYSVLLRSDNQAAFLRSGTVIQTVSFTPTDDGWHQVQFSALNASVQLSVDNLELLSFQDPEPLNSGGIQWKGLIVEGSAIWVDDLALYVDTTEVLSTSSPTPEAELVITPLIEENSTKEAEFSDSSSLFATGVVFVVNNTSDTPDADLGDGVCDTALITVGSQCSLRAAMQEANESLGFHDTIAFNIAGTGVKTIAPLSALPVISDSVTIDGYTQPGSALASNINPATLRIEISGAAIPYSTQGTLTVTSGSSTIRGLIINRSSTSAIKLETLGGNTIEGNYIGTNATGSTVLSNQYGVFINGSPNNVIGGQTPSQRNLISGNFVGIFVYGVGATGNIIKGNYVGTNATGSADLGNLSNGVQIDSSGNTIGGIVAGAGNLISGNDAIGLRIIGSDNLVQGNYIGTNAAGNADLGNGSNGISISGSNNIVGGSSTGARNLISGNGIVGLSAGGGEKGIRIVSGTGNTIQGNYIGTDISGSLDIGNDEAGIEIEGSSNNLIGGSAQGAGNLISGNNSSGIVLWSGDNTVSGNYIGTNATGTSSLSNSGDGISIFSSNNIVGGTAVGEGNIIAFNQSGVSVQQVNNSILGNSIFSNSHLGIDLQSSGAVGLTPNDTGDTDIGANNLQNFPFIFSAIPNGGNIEITGILHSVADSDFRIEFFSSTSCDPSGNGEGQFYLGFSNVTTNSSGIAMISVAFPTPLQQIITATATDSLNNSSEFSECTAINEIPGVVSNVNNIGPGSLRKAISFANANINVVDIITFNIPGTGIKTINLLTPLPAITDPVTIDGTTQAGFVVNPLIVLNGANAGSGADGLHIIAGNSTVRGLAIVSFSDDAIELGVNGSNTIQGNNLGTDSSGMLDQGNGFGIYINNTPNNMVGGTIASARNVISGNNGAGMWIEGASASGNIIQGNFIGTKVAGNAALGNSGTGVVIVDAGNNLIGGTTTGARNLISGNAFNGIYIDGSSASGNIIQGNYIGTNAAGTAPIANSYPGIYVYNAPNTVIGGTALGARNLISGNLSDGLVLNGAETSGTLVQGNFIGTNASGTAKIPNQGSGIYIYVADGNTIGGSTADARNLISGNSTWGIVIDGTNGSAANNLVQGNYIGTNTTGTASLGNGYNGMLIFQASNNTVGGINAGEGNLIAFNVYSGVTINTGTGNLVSGNSMFGNGTLGIELYPPSGVNQNDGQDLDTGSNSLQNFPTITYLQWNGPNLSVGGNFNSAANSTFRIELFANASCDSSGSGEGQTYLGFVNVTTNNVGSASFVVGVPMPSNKIITATATDSNNNTSEFSPCYSVPRLTVAPVLSSPAANALLNLNTPTFSWDTVYAAFGYEYQIATDLSFSNLVYTGLTAANFTTPTGAEALNDGQYYWRVRALNQVQAPGPWSLSRNFIIDTTAPAAPILNQPLNAGLSTSARPAFSWFAAATANRYLLQVDNDSDFSSTIITNEVALLSYSSTISLPQGIYYWRVQARDAALNWGSFGEVRSFTVNIQNLPTNNAFTSDSTPAFQWFAWTGATRYQLQVSSTSDFNTLFFEFNTTNASTLSYSPMTVMPNGVYYWRVNVDAGAGFATSPFYRTVTVTPAAPLAPVLVTPITNALWNSPELDLNWNASTSSLGQPYNYQLQVDNDSNFASPLLDTSVSATTYHLSTLSDGKYYWRVRTVNYLGLAGLWTVGQSFTIDTVAPAAPVLSRPLNAAVSTTARPVFAWLASATATLYHLQLDNDSDFSSPIINQELATLSYSSSLSLPQGIYYWRVQARDAALNWGSFGEERSFSLNIQTLPANNGYSTDSTPAFSWAAWTGATRYQLQVSSQTNFSSLIIEFNTLNASVLSHSSLTALGYGTYYWRVNIDTGSGFLISPFYFTVTITPTPAAPPVLSSPAAGFLMNDNTPDFAWSASVSTVGQPFSYQIQIDNNVNFSSPEVDTTVSPIAYTSPALPDGLHYWRVRTVNSLNVAGAWSASRTFTIDTVAPAAPVLSRPLNAAVSTTARPVFAWLASATATLYHLQLDNDSDFSSPIINQELATLSYSSSLSLPQGIYYWRVQARDAALNWGSFGEERSFSLNIQTLPANNGYSTDSTPAFSWAAWTGATRYQLQVSSQTNFSSLIIEFNTLNASVLSHSSLTALGYGTYYWRVNIDTGSGFLISPFYFTVTITPPAPLAPLLLSPAAASSTNDTSPSLVWNATSSTNGQPFTYQVQVDNNSNFSSPEQNVSVSTTSYTTAVLPTGTYFWRVRAVNYLGYAGAWSVVRAFTIVP